jgi:glutamine synthetase
LSGGFKPTEATEGSAYSDEFSLHRHLYSSLDALRDSEAMRSILGDVFVDLYCDLKENEYRKFQEIITPWEREILMFNV